MTFAVLSLVLLAATPCAATAAEKVCTAATQQAADTSLSSARGSWNALYKYYLSYFGCDDGFLAEGNSDAVVRLLAEQWDRLGELNELAKKAPTFRSWVLRHIDATASDDDLKTIIESSAKCPAVAKALCADVRAAAERALREAEEAESADTSASSPKPRASGRSRVGFPNRLGDLKPPRSLVAGAAG